MLNSFKYFSVSSVSLLTSYVDWSCSQITLRIALLQTTAKDKEMKSTGIKWKDNRYGEYTCETGKMLSKTKDYSGPVLIPDSLPSNVKMTGLKQSILFCCSHILYWIDKIGVSSPFTQSECIQPCPEFPRYICSIISMSGFSNFMVVFIKICVYIHSDISQINNIWTIKQPH